MLKHLLSFLFTCSICTPQAGTQVAVIAMASTAILLFFAAFIFIVVVLYRQHDRPLPLSFSEKPKASFLEDQKPCRAAILHTQSGPYTYVHDWPRPRISSKELLVRNRAIGLNPIDWKCVAYGFGIYSTPWVSGREAAGTIENVGEEVKGFQKGDRVWLTSTSYRDNRTSTFQEVSLCSGLPLSALA